MLYAFLLEADPSNCGCEVLAEEIPGPEARNQHWKRAPIARWSFQRNCPRR